MSRKRIKKKKIVDKYKCLQCGHNWTRIRKPGPYWGSGWDKNGKPTTKEQDDSDNPYQYWFPKEPTCPEHGSCPKCGHSYYEKIN